MAQPTADAPDTLERAKSEAARSEPLPPALLPGWRAIPHAIIRARGEEGYIELVALHPQKGVALLAFLAKNEVAEPAAAREAFAAMLGEVEFAQHFPGSLPIVALALSAPADDLDRRLGRAFAAEPAPSVSPGWVEWLEKRLAPAATPAAAPPRLAAPLRDEDPPPPPIGALLVAPSRTEDETPGEGGAVIEAPDPAPPPASEAEAPRWTDWGISLGVASGIVLALLTVLALFSRTGRLF